MILGAFDRVNFAGRGGSFDGSRVSQPSTACLDFRLASKTKDRQALPVISFRRIACVISNLMRSECAELRLCSEPARSRLDHPNEWRNRLSGFLLWQGVHTEFYFTDVLWPALRKVDSSELSVPIRHATAVLVANDGTDRRGGPTRRGFCGPHRSEFQAGRPGLSTHGHSSGLFVCPPHRTCG
jgi:hypothetical protein